MIKTKFVLTVSMVAFVAVGVAHADIASTTYFRAGDNISINDGEISATVPTVNNATLTIQKNGTMVDTFTANASTNKTINITVPTGSLASKSAVASADITDGTIVNADISASAAIAQSKIANLTTDLAGKLANTSTVKNAIVTTDANGAVAPVEIVDSGTGTYVTDVAVNAGKVTLSRGTPSIPTVNNATLTIQKNGTDVATFTANSGTAATANITVPTKVSELTNDSNYATKVYVDGQISTISEGNDVAIAEVNQTISDLDDAKVAIAQGVASKAVITNASGNITTGTIATGMITDGAVTSAKIADASVASADLASNSVTTAKITDLNVTTAKIAASAVTTVKIADSAVTAAKTSGVIGSIPSGSATSTDYATIWVE